MDPGFVIYVAVGVSVLLPLGARLAGNRRLARRLDLLPRFAFGFVCALLAFDPGATFTMGDSTDSTPGQSASSSVGHIVFGLLALFLIGGAIRILVKRDYDRPDSDEEENTP